MPEHLLRLLRRAGRLTLLTEVARATFLAGAVLVGAILLALLIDAVLALRPTWLIAVDCVLAGLVLAAATFVGRQLYRQLFNARHLARVIETRAGIRDSRLINAIDLASHAPHAASPEFVQKSVTSGDAAADALSPRAAINFTPLRKAMSAIGVAVLAAVVIHIAVPGLFSTVTRRYLHPTVMHPPFTLLTFDVAVEPQKIYHGRSAAIKARISGPGVPDRASVVFVDQKLESTQAMLRSDESTAAEKLFVLPIDRADRPRQFYIDAPGGRSELFTLSVLPVPTFESLTVQYNFPQYTGWPSITRTLGQEGIHALVGTEAVITAGSNIPLRGGTIQCVLTQPPETKAPIQMTLAPDDPATVVGRFPIVADGTYDITLAGIDGTPSDEHRGGPIAVVLDKPPTIEITEPVQHVAVPEEYAVGVAIRAQDDVGIDRISLSRSVNGWKPSTIDLPLQRERPTNANASYVFDLPTLGAHAGDVITYFATAYDNLPGGGQSVDTPTFIIEVISTEEYMEYARTQYQMEQIEKEAEEFNKRLDQLKAERDKLLEQMEPLKQKAEQGAEMSPDDLEKMKQLEQDLKKYQEDAAKLAEDARQRADQQPLYEFEQPYQETLKSLAQKLDKQAENAEQTESAAQQAQQQPNQANSKSMAAAAEKFKKESEPFDEQTQQETRQTSQDMDAMKLADDMVSQAERIRQVIMAQRDLADRMSQFQNQQELSPSDQLKAHRMAEEQDQLREELKDAREKLDQAAEKAQERLPKMSSQAKQLCQSIGDMQVENDQSQAAEQARSGAGREAHADAEQAAKNLEKLLSDCNSQQMQEQASDELDGCLKLPKNGLRKSMKQMAQGRGVPGLGKKNGDGSGFSGSQPRMMVMGPHIPTGTKTDAQSGATGRTNARAAVPLASIGQDAGAETLNPELSASRQNTAGAMSGVPVQYRDQAEAYFRRLAEESRKKRGDQ